MNQDPEKQYYENTQLWSAEAWKNHTADLQRIQLAWAWIPKSCHTILDIGCGNGIFLRSKPEKLIAIGLERSWAGIRSSGLLVVQGDAANLPLYSESFDIVTCMEVLEHLPYPFFIKAVAELVRVSRRYILITVPFSERREYLQIPCPQCGCLFHPNYHVRSFKVNDIKNLFLPFEGVSIVHYEAIVPQFPQKRFGFFWNMIRLYLHRGGRNFPDYTVCPQCGYRNSAKTTINSSRKFANKPSKLKFSDFWPVRNTYIWWMALYEKERN